MTCYVVFLENEVNHEKLCEYRSLVTETLVKYHGKFIVRGGHCSVVEGSWPFERTVIIEFVSRERAQAWYSSPEYQNILALRLNAMSSNAVIVDGLDGP